MIREHLMPFGAECQDHGVRFRLWAPKARTVDVCFGPEEDACLPMDKLDAGWFELETSEMHAGARYKYQIDGKLKVPDPASRFQPQDVHGPSQVIDPREFDWIDTEWHGRPWEEAVIYELHVGAFSPAGTFSGVEKRLDYLSDLGITAIELMPLSDFPGRRNWGYDGVLPYGPDSSYGPPDELKRLIQAAHKKGLMVFLDVVYNHFGPDGNYLPVYAPQFFTGRHRTPWGDAINFDGAESRNVRDFFIHNALYWLEEYHFDGLRFDAVHAIKDDSEPDILVELAEAVRSTFGRDRYVHLILENGDNAAHYLKGNNAHGYNAQWNDDIHQSLHVQITGETDGYYSDYAESPVELLGRCLAEGFAFQGEFSKYQNAPRGEPSAALPPVCFVNFMQNHDQIGNRAFGERITQLAQPAAIKAVMAVLLLAPSPPLLFMGEEFAASSPFLFFCDFSGELAVKVTDGRRNEFSRFEKFNSPETLKQIPDPNSEKTFLNSKLDWQSVTSPGHRDWLNYYRQLLATRKAKVVPHLKTKVGPHLKDAPGNSGKFSVDGKSVLKVNWRLENQVSMTMLANLGSEPASASIQPDGETIFATPAGPSATQQALPPWYVEWFLHR